MKIKTGFTLIELLISIAIGMLVIGFGSVTLNNFNEQQKINSTSQELLANLRLARNYATTNQLNPGASKTIVDISQDGLMKIDDDKGKSFFNKDISPKGIIITSPTIIFSVTDGRLIGGSVEITITGDDSNSDSKTIKIDNSGLIYEKQ